MCVNKWTLAELSASSFYRGVEDFRGLRGGWGSSLSVEGRLVAGQGARAQGISTQTGRAEVCPTPTPGASGRSSGVATAVDHLVVWAP